MWWFVILADVGIAPNFRGMAHIVCRKGYYSLEESYRDEQGRPRKRRLAYYGRRNPLLAALGVPSIDWQATLQGTPEDRAMQAAERAAEKAGEREIVEEPSRLPSGLEQGPREAVEVEKPSSTIDYASPPQSSPGPQGQETPADVSSDVSQSGEAPSGSDTGPGDTEGTGGGSV